MPDDTELLRRYVDDHSDEAFTALVQRHLGLVYGAALRRVGGDAHLAEDVAQQVFCALARKAATLRGRASLAGWLYVSAQHAAAAVVRREQRRKTREAAALTMQILNDDSSAPPNPEGLRLMLDDLIAALRDDEREALALRFFGQRTFGEIGAALRVTEDTARKRVDRAIEKLRAHFARRGITTTGAMLAVALGEIGATAAPTGLAAKIASHAFLRSAPVGAGSSLLARLGLGLGVAAGFVAGGWLVAHQHRANQQLAAELTRLEGEQRAITALEAGNRQLARAAREADDLRRAAVELPVLRDAARPAVASSAQAAPAQATLTVEADGTLRWKWGAGSGGAERVSLGEFIKRLNMLQQTGDGKLGIRGFSEFSPLAYTIGQACKTQVTHVVVESGAAIDPRVGRGMWFGRR